MRGTTDIPGATSTSYSTVRDDGSQAVSARLTPSAGMTAIFGSAGVAVRPFRTNAVTVAKAVDVKTKTKVRVAKRIRVNERASVKVKVTVKSGVPDGHVTLTIGKFKARKKLKQGSVFINLPILKAGTYTITTKYAGEEGFKKSKGKKTTVTVG
jgi:Bacterial Ig-like domain (group 3)